MRNPPFADFSKPHCNLSHFCVVEKYFIGISTDFNDLSVEYVVESFEGNKILCAILM